jgi:hypothetical protein
VQRSAGLSDWVNLGEVSAFGFSDTKRNYNFTDRSPLFGAGYYRLMIVDYDGYTEYSPIRSVYAEMEAPEILLYPNPARDQFHVEVPDVEVWFELYNTLGRLETIELEKRDGVHTFHTHHLAKGVYFLKVHTAVMDETIKVIIE